MCGLVGWLVSDRVDLARAQAAVSGAAALLAHRGPDDAGRYQTGRLLLEHRRLSILDLSRAGHQPMLTPDGRFAIAYNGEVYNYRELAAELRSQGWSFTSSSDTEVILAAFARWGRDALERFDGMFALALWDDQKRELLLARDRAGIKPLYYRDGPEGLLFASEIKSLAHALPDAVGRPDSAALLEIMTNGYVAGDATPFGGVRALRAGEYLVADERGRIGEQGFFHTLDRDIREDDYRRLGALTDDEHAERLDRLLQRSIELHLASDAPLGVLCSGGLDSSIVTAVVHRTRPDVEIFHSTFDGQGSEEVYARQVAEHLGCKITYVKMDRDYYLGSMVAAVWHADIPSFHPNDISLYSVCEAARQKGCKVLLSGEGADELLGGYAWHQLSLRRYRRLARLSRWARADGLPGKLRNRLRSLLEDWLDLLSAPRDALWGVAYPLPNQRLVAQAAQGMLSGGHRWKNWHEGLAGYHFVADAVERQALAHIYSNLYTHLDSLLWRNDRMGMMASIENRVPYLENELMAHAVNLPLRVKIRGREGKWILKRVAERYLPQSVIYRPKAGFPVPASEYVADLQPALHDGFVAESFHLTPGMIDAWIEGDSRLLYRLLNLEIWGRLFVERQPAAEVQGWLLARANGRGSA